MQLKPLFLNRGNNRSSVLFFALKTFPRLFWKKRALILSALLVFLQIASPLSIIVTYAAPTASNDVGSTGALDPVGNKATRLQMQGSSGVDQSSGAFTYSYPLSVPDGRQGVSPKLSLSYNSQNTDSGWFGYNWVLSTPYIERTSKNGTDVLYTNPAFVSSLHGEIISSNGVNFEQKVDDGSYAQYTFTGNSWQMVDRDGNVYYFGNNDSSRISDASSTKIGRWYITEMRDKFGNGIIYNYTKDSGTVYPYTISYTEHALAHPLNLITFNLEAKNDQLISYKYGFRTVDTKRINNIKVATNGKDNAYFTFTYVTGSNGVRSLLQSIEEKHLSTNGDWTTLPKTTFEYENSATSFSGTVSNSSSPYGSNIVLDTDNDGKQDLYNAGDGYYAIDINGDYKKDLMQSDIIYNFPSSGLYINFKYNQGGSFLLRSLALSSSPAYLTSMLQNMPAPPLRASVAGASNFQEAAIVDVNGDGFDDVAYNDVYGGSGVGINTTNNSFNYASSSGLSFDVINDEIADINGDGFQDKIVKSYTSTSTVYKVYLNNGTSYLSAPDFSYDAQASSTSLHHDLGVRFVDVNNDGLIDVVRSYKSDYNAIPPCDGFWQGLGTDQRPVNESVNTLLLNVGNNFVATSSALGGYISLYTGCPTNGNYGLSHEGTKEYDTDGNLTVDYDGAINNTSKQDVLKKINTSLGSTLDVSYQWTTKTGLNATLPVPIYIVSTTTDKLSISDTSPHVVGYSFYNGEMYFDANSPRDHKFGGFAHVDVVDGDKKTVTYFHQGNGDDYTTGESGDSYYNIGRPYRVDTFDLSSGTSTLVSKMLSLYTTYTNASSSFTYLDSQVSNVYNPDGTFLSSATKNVYDKSKRLIKTSYAYGDIEPFVSFASSTIADKGTDIVTTQYEYTNARPQRIIHQVSTDYANNNISDVVYYYDNLPLGLVDKGAMTNAITSIYNSDGTINATSSLQTAYDATGNIVQTVDGLNHITKINYDSGYYFPLTKIDALNGTTTYTYDPYTLNLLTTKGPDGITYAKETDGLGKVIRSYSINSTGGNFDEIRTSYVYGGGISVYSRKIADSGNLARSFQAYDSYGRLIQSKKEVSMDVFSTQDTIYDAYSNVTKESLPYITTGYGLTTNTPSNGSTVYTYDGLGRVLTKSSFDQTVSYAYGARSLIVSDNASTQHKKSYGYDAQGNIIQVNEYNGSSIYTTNYNYTPFGKISRITDANGNIRNFSYLSNGSLTYQEDPHNASDTTFTTYSYSYDILSNLISKVGPLGTTTYTYDALNRPSGRVVSDSNHGSSTVNISYSGCSNNYTSPCSITRNTSSTTLTYNINGQISSEMLSIDGKTFTRSYTYDLYSNPLTVTFPDSGKEVYTYGLDGKQLTLNYVTPSGTTKNIVTASTYNSLNQLSSLSFGNGVQMCNTYTNQSTDGIISPRLGKSVYLFNSNGCDLSVSNQVELYKDEFSYKDGLTPSSILTTYKDIAGTTHTKQDTYTYDNLARLTQVSTSYDSGTAIADTLTYDPIGNIIRENDVLYRYSQDGMQNAHAATSIGSEHISYDAQGNRIQSGDSAYSWNALNQLVSATSTSGTELYTYDENGERIKKVVEASVVVNQHVTPATATSTAGSFASGDLLTSVSTSSTYIATSTYDTLSSLSILSTTTLFTLVSSYYGSPFTSKFCAATSTPNRQSCIVATTEQLLANDINGRSTTTVATNGLITDIIKIATGEYLIPTSYAGIATSSIAASDGTIFSTDSGTISSYSTYTSTGIVVVMSEYSNLPYVSSSTYTSLQQIGLTDTSKVKALLILAGCTSTTSACTMAEKVIFEKFYKESGYLLSDKTLQEMWYVFAQKARLPGNSNEFTSTSTTLGAITVPTVSGLATSTATTTYYTSLYFTTEYTNQNNAELRLQFFNTIPYLVTQSTFTELSNAGITQTTAENYKALLSDLFSISLSSSTDYVTALNAFIQYDKKKTLSISALRELYLVMLGAATIPDSESEYSDYATFDLSSYLNAQSYQYNGFTGLWDTYSSTCNAGYPSGPGSQHWTRCVLSISTFTLPVATSSSISYAVILAAAPQPTDAPLVIGSSTSVSSGVGQTYTYTTASDGSHLDADVTPIIVARLAGSTTTTVLVANSNEFVTGPQYLYEAQSVKLKAYVNTPRLTVASTSLMTLASQYVTTYWTATTSLEVSTSDIKAYYKMENTSDSINSYSLTNVGSVTFGLGKIDNGADLGDSNSTKYLHVDSTFGYTSNAQPLSMTCWIKASSTPSSGSVYTIANKMNGAGSGGGGGLWRWYYYNDSGTPQLRASNDFGPAVASYNVTFTPGTWYLVGMTFSGNNNGSSLKLYINGTSTASANGYGVGDFSAYTDTLSLGSNRNGSADYWSGSIDECGVWKQELSATDMSNLYNGGAGNQYPFGILPVEKISTSTQTATIQAAVENYFGEVYDSANDITLPTSTTTTPLTFISHEAYNEFASTTLTDAYDLSKIFLATTTSSSCVANSSTTQCDKINRESNFKQIVGSYSGFIPSDSAIEEFWMVHKGILTLPYSTTSASVLYSSSTNPVIVVNNATTSVNVFLRSWLSSTLSTSTATTSINLGAIPPGILTALQYNSTYSTSTFALATSTIIVSEATYNELLHTPVRANSDVSSLFAYALPYATSTCPGEAATSSCVISAQKTKAKDIVSAVSGFVISDAALEELYRVYSGSISIVPVSNFNSTDSTGYQSLIVPLDTADAFTTFSTTTVGATSTPAATTGNCSFGTSGATSSLCYILIPYLNSSLTALNLSFYVSTTSMTTGTLTSYLSYMTQDATSTGATSTPTFTTTISTSTITGTRSGTKFTFDLTSLYTTYLNSASPRLILIPDGNGTSTNIYSVSSTTLGITRLVTTPQINYQEFSATTTTVTTTTTAGASVSTSTLKAYYKLENVNDSVNSYTLTNVNSTPFNAGKIDNGADFGTSNSTKYLHVDNTLGYTSNAQAISMSCWVNVSTAPSSGAVYTLMNKMNGSGFGSNGGLWRWYYYNNSGTTQLKVSNDYGSSGVTYNTTLSTGTWYQVGFTFSGSNAAGSLKLYVNGTSTASANGYGNGSFEGYTNTLSLGSNRNGSADYWSGLMDECGVWNAELSSSEMSALYSSGNGVQYPFATTTITTSSTTSAYGVNVAVPIPFDRGTISSYATTTATSTIDMTNAPQLDFSTSYLSALGNSVIKTVTNAGALATSNILYYKLDGNSNDSSPSGYNGSDTSITYSSGNGKINNGAGFNGSNSNIGVSSSLTDVGNTSPMSFSFWIKTSTSGSFGWVASRQNNSNFHSQWDIYHNSSGQIGFQINPTNSGSDQLVVHSGTAINNNTWHHVVLTYSGSKLASGVKIYVDGTSTSITTDTNNLSSASPTGVPIFIGNRGAAGSPFNGAIDEFGIWSRELSASDVTSLYNGGTGYQYPFATSTSATSTYSGTYIDPMYGQLPTEPQQVLPAVSYPYATSTATSTINTLTIATTTSYTSYTPFSSYQEDSRGTRTTYFTLNGNLVGTYTYEIGNEASTGKVTYLLTNYLGTPVVSTDDRGDIVEMDMTDVFGNYVQRDIRKDNAEHTRGFTNQDYDDVTGLNYFHARYLDTKAHSFLSVDPMIYTLPKSYLLDPQQMNSYVYSRNNPVIYTDPTGLYNVDTGKVDKGDTLSDVVKKLNTTWGTSYTENGLAFVFNITNPNALKAGQTIQLQAPTAYQQYSNGVYNALFNPVQAYTNLTSGNATAAQKAGLMIGAGALPLSVAGSFMVGVGETRMAIGATGKLGEAFLETLGGRSQVYKETSLGGRFIDQLVDGVANESKVGYTTLTKTINRQIAKDSELLIKSDSGVNEVVWHFFQSPVTGKGGASAPLIEALESAGIKYILH